ncbi:hypothetical protein [Salicola sp. Rm-C-2C1-2]|uniref:hypothetical protein n=1 Tax=Salicola sp. Rm-C-2C1-2 TaxID=3141321 RepID=UPI0032E40E5E
MPTTLMAALAGALVGGLLSGLGFWYRVRVERIARINEALFYLIELFRILQAATVLDYRFAIDVFFAELEHQYPGYSSEQDRANLTPMLRQLIADIQEAQGAEFSRDFAERFSQACSAVAPHSPLLAARINSNRYLRVILPELDKYYRAIQEAARFESPSDVREEIERASDFAQKQIGHEFVKELRKDVALVASQTSVVTLVLCVWKFLWKTDARAKKKYRGFIQRIVPKLVEEYENEPETS